MPNQITVLPMQWTPIQDIKDVEPLSDADAECLAEIRDVLMRHKKLKRFAIHLIHKHFELHDEEVMCEYTDAESRTLTLVPKKLSELSGHIETTWALDASGPLTACMYACVWTKQGVHAMQHFGKAK